MIGGGSGSRTEADLVAGSSTWMTSVGPPCVFVEAEFEVWLVLLSVVATLLPVATISKAERTSASILAKSVVENSEKSYSSYSSLLSAAFWEGLGIGELLSWGCGLLIEPGWLGRSGEGGNVAMYGRSSTSIGSKNLSYSASSSNNDPPVIAIGKYHCDRGEKATTTKATKTPKIMRKGEK